MTKEEISKQLKIPIDSVDDIIDFAKVLKTASAELKAEMSIILHAVQLVVNKK